MKCGWGSFLGRGDPIGVEYSKFEVVGASNWAWRKGRLVGVKITNQATRAQFLANKTWGCSFSGRGDPIWVEYTRFEVVGASDWAWHKGGLLEPKSQKLSHQGSVLADDTCRASVLGRRDLDGARTAKLREGGGGSLTGMQSGIWFDSPVSFQIPSLFPNPLPPQPFLILHSNSLESSGGLCMDGMWWWVVLEEKRLVAVWPSRAITSRT